MQIHTENSGKILLPKVTINILFENKNTQNKIFFNFPFIFGVNNWLVCSNLRISIQTNIQIFEVKNLEIFLITIDYKSDCQSLFQMTWYWQCTTWRTSELLYSFKLIKYEVKCFSRKVLQCHLDISQVITTKIFIQSQTCYMLNIINI